jgi:hypothetical protein
VDKNEFKQLAKKYINEELTEDELKKFLSMLEDREDEFYQAVDDEIRLEHTADFNMEAAFDRILQDERFSKVKPVRRLSIYAWTAVACTILIMLGSLFYFNQQDLQQPDHIKTVAVPEKSRQENKLSAIRLADGTQLALKDIGRAEHNYDGVKLSRVSESVIMVSLDPKRHASKTPYHEFTTERGTSYTLLLPDGSKVDLNSGSTFRLDPGFNILNRNCELSGEAYFDVKRNEAMAFQVKTRDYDVKVLGTQFNIKTYSTTTYSQTALVKGSVHIVKGGKEIDLLPGDQLSAEAGVLLSKSRANLRDVLAWKEGYFRFTDATIEEIMQDIATWYDIDDMNHLQAQSDVPGA